MFVGNYLSLNISQHGEVVCEADPARCRLLRSREDDYDERLAPGD